MQLSIIQKQMVILVSVMMFWPAGGLWAAESPIAVKVTDAQRAAMNKATFEDASEARFKHPKIAAALLEIVAIEQTRGDWRTAATNMSLLTRGQLVLVEMRLNPDSARAAAWRVENLGGEIRHHNVPALMEVWLPVKAIEKCAELGDVQSHPAGAVGATHRRECDQ